MAGKSKIVKGALDSLVEFFSRQAEKTPMPKMKKDEIGFGLHQFSNDRIGFVGGNPDPNRPGWAHAASATKENPLARLNYTVYDLDLYKQLGLGAETANKSEVGKVTLNVKVDPQTGTLSDKIDGIINLELNPEFRGGNTGRRIINSLIANTDDGLKVHDLRPTVKSLRKGGSEKAARELFIPKPQGALRNLVDE